MGRCLVAARPSSLTYRMPGEVPCHRIDSIDDEVSFLSDERGDLSGEGELCLTKRRQCRGARPSRAAVAISDKLVFISFDSRAACQESPSRGRARCRHAAPARPAHGGESPRAVPLPALRPIPTSLGSASMRSTTASKLDRARRAARAGARGARDPPTEDRHRVQHGSEINAVRVEQRGQSGGNCRRGPRRPNRVHQESQPSTCYRVDRPRCDFAVISPTPLNLRMNTT